MNKIALSGIVAAAGLSASALAQQYTFQMQLVPDTTSGGINLPLGDQSNVTATRVAFWLQARVMSTGENWGIARASSPNETDASRFTISDSAGGSTLSRGNTNVAGTSHGRGTGFRSGGNDIGQIGNNINGPGPGTPPVPPANPPGAGGPSAAYPSSTNNNNGAIDSGGTRIYGFDAYVGFTRNVADLENPYNPWGVNGAINNSGADVPSVTPNTFSPWANLYRVWVDISNFGVERDVTLAVHTQLNAGSHTVDVGGGVYPMQLGAGQTLESAFTFHIVPTPGAAAVLGLGGLMAGRRRR